MRGHGPVLWRASLSKGNVHSWADGHPFESKREDKECAIISLVETGIPGRDMDTLALEGNAGSG